jgi:hypothetical protein
MTMKKTHVVSSIAALVAIATVAFATTHMGAHYKANDVARAKSDRELLTKSIAAKEFPGERAGYAYSWLAYIDKCSISDDEDAIYVKYAMSSRDYLHSSYWLQIGFNQGRNDGTVDSKRYIAAYGMELYCLTVTKLSIYPAFIESGTIL